MTATEAGARAPATSTPKLNKALSQLQGELPQVKKTKTGKVEGENKAGKFFSYEYSYADLGDVVADVGPLLAKHGLAFHCGPTINPADRREMILLWALLHESGEEKTGEWPLGPANQKPQSLGSAITYGRRYCFTAATNIVLEDDDDGQRAQQDHGSRQSAGDAWENATPARPQQDDTPYRRLLAAANAFTTSTGADQVTRDAAAAKNQRLITRDQCDEIQNKARTRLDNLRKNARPVKVEDLARQAARSDEGQMVENEPGTVTKAQLTKLHTVLTGLGFGGEDREQKLRIAEVIAGRAPLTGPEEGRSSKNLSWTEAKKLIGKLDEFTDEKTGERDRDALIAYMAEREQAGNGDD
jgi:hypothetical protein